MSVYECVQIRERIQIRHMRDTDKTCSGVLQCVAVCVLQCLYLYLCPFTSNKSCHTSALSSLHFECKKCMFLHFECIL